MVKAYRSPFPEEPPNLRVSAHQEGEAKVTALAEASTTSVPMPRTLDEITTAYFHVNLLYDGVSKTHEECVPILHFKSTLCERMKVVIVLHRSIIS